MSRGTGASRHVLASDLNGNDLHASADYVANPQDVGSMGIGVATSGFPAIGTTDVELTAGSDRRVIAIHNNGLVTLFVGPSGIATANAYPVVAQAQISFNATSGIRLYAKTEASTTDVRIIELA